MAAVEVNRIISEFKLPSDVQLTLRRLDQPAFCHDLPPLQRCLRAVRQARNTAHGAKLRFCEPAGLLLLTRGFVAGHELDAVIEAVLTLLKEVARGRSLLAAFSMDPDGVAVCPDTSKLVNALFEALAEEGEHIVELEYLKELHGGDEDLLFNYMGSDSDGLITEKDLQTFFSTLEQSKGANSVRLLIEYLRLNAQAEARGDGITMLPVCQLLLMNDFAMMKPAAVLSPDATLSEVQAERVTALFGAIDADQSGSITKVELSAVWGGDSDGLFDALDLDSNGCVSLHEWFEFFGGLLKEEGVKVVEFAIQYFENALRAQKTIAESISLLGEAS